MKSFSKLTRATNKNFFTIPNQKLLEKAEYHNLYLDLVFSRQAKRNYITKRCLKGDSMDFPKIYFII